MDGKEGGTGAAPLEFMDHIGMPMREGLNFVHNALVGAGLRHKMKLGCSGKILTAFDMARAMALGADWCNSARGFMFALGCIQSLSCHTDTCPTGVATQDPARGRAIHVPDKIERVANFHRATLHSLPNSRRRRGSIIPTSSRSTISAGAWRKAGWRVSPISIRRWTKENCCAARATRGLRALWDKARADRFTA